MASILLGVRLMLAAVFAAAAAGKLLDLPGSRKALADFGLPVRVASIAGLVLPLAELAVAIALIPAPSARWGALGALLLLLAFLGGIAGALRRGEAPDCHCFGQIHSAPAGPGTLIRNGVLAALAALVLWQGGGPAIDDWIAARSGAELVAVALGIVAALAGLQAHRLWQANRALRAELKTAQAELAMIPAGLQVGLPAPSFVLTDLEGATRSLESLCDRGHIVVLVFATPDCAGCQQLLPDIARWQASLSDRLTIAVVSMGTIERNRPAFAEHGIGDVLLQENVEVMSDYRVRATPSAVLVGPDGRIASAAAAGAVTIESLIRIALRREPSALAIGTAAIERAISEPA